MKISEDSTEKGLGTTTRVLKFPYGENVLEGLGEAVIAFFIHTFNHPHFTSYRDQQFRASPFKRTYIQYSNRLPLQSPV